MKSINKCLILVALAALVACIVVEAQPLSAPSPATGSLSLGSSAEVGFYELMGNDEEDSDDEVLSELLQEHMQTKADCAELKQMAATAASSGDSSADDLLQESLDCQEYLASLESDIETLEAKSAASKLQPQQ